MQLENYYRGAAGSRGRGGRTQGPLGSTWTVRHNRLEEGVGGRFHTELRKEGFGLAKRGEGRGRGLGWGWGGRRVSRGCRVSRVFCYSTPLFTVRSRPYAIFVSPLMPYHSLQRLVKLQVSLRCHPASLPACPSYEPRRFPPRDPLPSPLCAGLRP